jgi:hypothetical protein
LTIPSVAADFEFLGAAGGTLYRRFNYSDVSRAPQEAAGPRSMFRNVPATDFVLKVTCWALSAFTLRVDLLATDPSFRLVGCRQLLATLERRQLAVPRGSSQRSAP